MVRVLSSSPANICSLFVTRQAPPAAPLQQVQGMFGGYPIQQAVGVFAVQLVAFAQQLHASWPNLRLYHRPAREIASSIAYKRLSAVGWYLCLPFLHPFLASSIIKPWTS